MEKTKMKNYVIGTRNGDSGFFSMTRVIQAESEELAMDAYRGFLMDDLTQVPVKTLEAILEVASFAEIIAEFPVNEENVVKCEILKRKSVIHTTMDSVKKEFIHNKVQMINNKKRYAEAKTLKEGEEVNKKEVEKIYVCAIKPEDGLFIEIKMVKATNKEDAILNYVKYLQTHCIGLLKNSKWGNNIIEVTTCIGEMADTGVYECTQKTAINTGTSDNSLHLSNFMCMYPLQSGVEPYIFTKNGDIIPSEEFTGNEVPIIGGLGFPTELTNYESLRNLQKNKGSYGILVVKSHYYRYPVISYTSIMNLPELGIVVGIDLANKMITGHFDKKTNLQLSVLIWQFLINSRINKKCDKKCDDALLVPRILIHNIDVCIGDDKYEIASDICVTENYATGLQGANTFRSMRYITKPEEASVKDKIKNKNNDFSKTLLIQVKDTNDTTHLLDPNNLLIENNLIHESDYLKGLITQKVLCDGLLTIEYKNTLINLKTQFTNISSSAPTISSFAPIPVAGIFNERLLDLNLTNICKHYDCAEPLNLFILIYTEPSDIPYAILYTGLLSTDKDRVTDERFRAGMVYIIRSEWSKKNMPNIKYIYMCNTETKSRICVWDATKLEKGKLIDITPQKKTFFLLTSVVNKTIDNICNIGNLSFSTIVIVDPETAFKGLASDFLIRHEHENSILEIPGSSGALTYVTIPIIGRIEMSIPMDKKGRTFIIRDIPDDTNVLKIRTDKFFLCVLKNKQIFAAVFMEPTNYDIDMEISSLHDTLEIKKLMQRKISEFYGPQDIDAYIYNFNIMSDAVTQI